MTCSRSYLEDGIGISWLGGFMGDVVVTERNKKYS